MRHHVVPDFRSDHLVGHQANQTLQTLLQVAGARSERLPVATYTGVLWRMWQQTGDEDVVVYATYLFQPVADVIDFQLLYGALNLASSCK